MGINNQENELIVDITGMSYGGRGIGRHEGKVVFAPDTVPGDRVLVRPKKIKKSFIEASVKKRLKSSPIRLQPACDYFSKCGGCQWMSVPYKKQIEWKKEFILSALSRIGGFKETSLHRFTPSKDELHYRNRIKLTGQIDKKGKVHIGYLAAKSHDLVKISLCLIAEDPINDFIAWISNQSLECAPAKDYDFELEVRIIFAENDSSGLIVSVLSKDHNRKGKESSVLQQLSSLIETFDLVKNVYSNLEKNPRKIFRYDRFDDLTYHTSADEFQQINRKSNHELRQRILEKCRQFKITKVLDLYCGSGNLSLQLAAKGYEVCGVEINPQSIATAKHNLKTNQIVADYQCSSSDQITSMTTYSNPTFDLVIIDPPRAGLSRNLQNIAEHIVKMRPAHIFYVGCDPNTLARDIHFFGQEGYQIEYVEGFDFFPQTFHIETFIHLELEKS